MNATVNTHYAMRKTPIGVPVFTLLGTRWPAGRFAATAIARHHALATRGAG